MTFIRIPADPKYPGTYSECLVNTKKVSIVRPNPPVQDNESQNAEFLVRIGNIFVPMSGFQYGYLLDHLGVKKTVETPLKN